IIFNKECSMLRFDYAIFVNRSSIDSHWPIFEIISCTEAIIHASVIFIFPIIAWITWKAEPLHRNIRYGLIACIFKGGIGAGSRLVLLGGQHFVQNFEEYRILLLIASIERRMFYPFFALLLSQVTMERLVATFFWSWYEQQGWTTIFVLVGTGSVIEIFSAFIAFFLTFHCDILVPNIRWILFSVCAILLGAGLLKRRCGPSFGIYSLSRIYQLRENIAIMKMILKLAGPVTKYTTPALVFYYLYILPPKTSKYEFLRNFSIAIFDWWIAVLSLAITITFPVFDFRFQRVAVQIPIFRNLISAKNLNSAKVFSTKHVPNNANQATDLYFSILDKDLDVSRKTRVQSLPVKTPPKKVEMRYRII
ncbi:hypothetical protein PRIPAC_83025, partial [Pristionchus pacificus]